MNILDIGLMKQIAKESGTPVVANPTLQGGEASLESVEIGDANYAVGKPLYAHSIWAQLKRNNAIYGTAFFVLYTTNKIPYTKTTLRTFILSLRNGSSHGTIPCVGYTEDMSSIIWALYPYGDSEINSDAILFSGSIDEGRVEIEATYDYVFAV